MMKLCLSQIVMVSEYNVSDTLSSEHYYLMYIIIVVAVKFLTVF